MSTITVLPDDVANHIAAGEVIERPASVVKELLENSLDAGAEQIRVEIGVGGKAYIRVADDGCGMSRDDARLAFERHATSKIRCTEDIFSIATLGFRGEALPSIASVSKLKLVTQTPDEQIGTRIDIHGGEILNIMESGAAPGTFIEVNELFYKTPARLKFLKTPATELSYINTVIIEQALAHPDVGFTVENNGKEQLHVPAHSDLRQRIAGLFGRDLIRDLVEIHESAGSLELRGFIGLPACHRANRNYQKVFINRRAVKDKVIAHAIQQAYDTLIPKRRHPVAFLFVSMPYELVDVNVHPGKVEVRFINSQSVHQFVVKGIRHVLRTALNVSPTEPLASQASRPKEAEPEPPRQTDLASLARAGDSPESPVHTASTSQQETDQPTGQAGDDTRPVSPLRQAASDGSPPAASASVSDFAGLLTPFRHKGFSRFKPVGQFQNTYLLAQSGDDLFIIDQHAAHERIVYETLKAQQQATTLEIQQLLFPVSIELSHREQAVLEEHLDLLKQYGLEIEPFGGNTYLLKSVPTLLAKADYKKLLYDIIDQLIEAGKAGIEQKLDEVLIVMACHSAIRANHPLQESQVYALLRQMDAADFPYTCPHGRPTVLKISLPELEKKFGRIQ